MFKPRKLAELTPENLKILIQDIGGPGYYASADLYRWYVGMAKEGDMEPVSQRKFGGVLRELGYRSVVRRVEGKPTRCWFITRKAVRDDPTKL